MTGQPIEDSNRQKLCELTTFLRELRVNHGYTQQEVSQEIKVHRNSISRIETNHNFTVLRLYELAEFYDIPIVEFFCK